jgi:pyruvate dehydrogenase E2 component (dihydrolipoamide acetyltransferase)
VAYLIRLPAVAADSASGSLAQWLKKEGDRIEAGDIIAEVETDKAIADIEAEQGGILAKIVAPAGSAQLAVNAILGVILAEGESTDEIARALAEAGMSETPPPQAPAQQAQAPQSQAPQSQAQPPSSSAAASGDPAPAAGDRRFASPLARRLAAEQGLSLDGIAGSGPAGRIVRSDLGQAAANSPAAAPAASASTAPASATPAPAKPSQSTPPATHSVPHSNMRRAIARRLTESKQAIPHFYLTVHCHMDALLDLRKHAKRGGKEKLSVNDFIVRACALALREVPDMNVSWHADEIVFHDTADIAVAIATPGGLVTPVVRHADSKPLRQIATEIADLAHQAREHRLHAETLSGGSMTVSNLGMYGVSQFTAIINPPQAAILAVGAAEARAVVDEAGELRAATMMTVTLSADHRAVDGAIGARWLSAFKHLIENPVRILL